MVEQRVLAETTPESRTRGEALYRSAAYAWALVVALGLSYFVVRIPVQLTDCLANLFQVQGATWFQSTFAGVGGGYLRPALWLQIKLAFEAAGGHYTPVFRGTHAVQIVGCALLFVGVLRVRDRATALAVPLGIAVLFGLHTFRGTINEAFPINTYLTVILGCLAALRLSMGAPARWRDYSAVVLFVLLLLTVESGVLALVIMTVAWLTGARGVSARALRVAGLLLLAYFVVRFAVLSVGTPGLVERVSGFGFRAYEPQDLQKRFGAFPYPFYLYNIIGQVLTVLTSEPRTGVFVFTRSIFDGRLTVGQVISLVTSLVSSTLIIWYIAVRWRSWLQHLRTTRDAPSRVGEREFTHHDRLMLIFIVVLALNALLSFPYSKDVIVSPAGVFYALAVTVATSALLTRLASASFARAVPVAVVLALLATGWAVRLVGVHYQMLAFSFMTRNDWVDVDAWAARNRIDMSLPGRQALTDQLATDALGRVVPAPAFTERPLGDYRHYLIDEPN